MFPITNVPLSCCMAIINLSALVHLKKCFHLFLRNLLYYYFFATVSVYACRCAHTDEGQETTLGSQLSASTVGYGN